MKQKNNNTLSFIYFITLLFVASNCFAMDLINQSDPPTLRAELTEYDRQGNEVGRGLLKSLTRYPTLPNTFALYEELGSACDEIDCPLPIIHLFLVTDIAPSACGSTHYTAWEVSTLSGGPRRLDVIDHATRDCDDFIQDGWQVRLTQTSGKKEFQRFFAGSPRPVSPFN